MNLTELVQRDPTTWEIPQAGAMRVPVVLYAGEALVRDMDDKVREQACNVAITAELDDMLTGGARWAVSRGFGTAADLERIEERGQMLHAKPAAVSDHAKQRQRDEMGTLGSGNHYLEVDRVVEIFAEDAAGAFGLRRGDAVVLIHCGSRGLGHQIGTDYLRDMVVAAAGFGLHLPDRELACAPIESDLGRAYLGAMRAATNCALANRQILTHLARRVFADVVPTACLDLLFDVSHNTCKV